MSSVIVNSCLILNGNLSINDDLIINPTGIVISVPDPDLKKSFYSYRTNSYVTSNGQGRTIQTISGNVVISGLIDGKGQGYGSDRGPGANSVLTDSSNNKLNGYGASHAGLGYISYPDAPSPLKTYGNHETPVSIGSGSGYYHSKSKFVGEDTAGGSAIKIMARSGTISVNGAIDMNGQDGTNAGGASGGSVWLYGWQIDGTGSIKAEGGTTYLPINSGGGGGGYISLWHDYKNSFSGTLSVEGKSGGGQGKIFRKQTEPILEEKFTGSIWNTRWWFHDGTSITLNNNALFVSPDGNYDFPRAQSLFKVSGKNIITTLDYFPYGSQINQYGLNFLLRADSNNWVGLSKKPDGIFGVSCIDGSYSSSGVNFDYTNVTFRLVKTDSTFSFQYYNTDTTVPQTIYSDIIEGLANKVFSVFLNVEKPFSSMIIQQRRLTPLDISNGYVVMDGSFSDASKVALNVFSGTSQYFGSDFTTLGNKLIWDTTNLGPILSSGDLMRIIYDSSRSSPDTIGATYDNLKIFDGVISNAETTEAVLYVDPDFGSDASSGRQLSPLKNLFVASAWAKKGSTIVLYDGTHNPTEVSRKDLTIRGAEGAKPLITSRNVQDTTGSGWETNALSFYGCQGRVENVQIADSSCGIRIENTNLFEVSRNLIHDVSTAVNIINCDPLVLRNRIYHVAVGVDMTNSWDPYVYSNVIFDSTTAIIAKKVKNFSVVGNTIDNCGIAVKSDISSSGIVSSNSLTTCAVGLFLSSDSSVGSDTNNYTGTGTFYNGTPSFINNDYYADDPAYLNSLGPAESKDFHLTEESINITTGSRTYDDYLVDMDGVPRGTGSSAIGAYEFIPILPHTGDYYISGAFGDDHTNFGGLTDPFRTLDKAMLIADATIHIDGGHYDSYYLQLENQGLSLGAPFAIYTEKLNHILLYKTLSTDDAGRGSIKLPCPVAVEDRTNVAVNVVGGPSQYYGTDFVVESMDWFGNADVRWKNLGLDGFVEEGDVLRVVFKSGLQHKFLNAVLHSHYSNIEKERAIFVSPNGSDNTVSGIPGSDTGGNGSFGLPYRTIQKGLADSSKGDYIVAIAGEYPLFSGRDDRVLVPAIDRTALPDGRRYYEDLFMPKDFRSYGTVEYDAVPWTFAFDGNSFVNSGGGFLNFTFDGSNTVSATTDFQFYGDFECMATLRDAVDPLKFVVSNGDSSVYFIYDNSNFTSEVYTGGSYYWTDGSIGNGTYQRHTVTEYIAITANDVRNKYVALSFIPKPDASNTSLNIVGGVAQNYGKDYYIQDSKIKWDEMNLEQDLSPGDILRIIYDDEKLSDPVKVSLSLKNSIFTVKYYQNGWHTALMKNIAIPYDSTWTASFLMDQANPINHDDIYGKGFVSQFLVIAEAFTGYDSTYAFRTERKTITLYGSDTSAPRLVDAYFDYEVI